MANGKIKIAKNGAYITVQNDGAGIKGAHTFTMNFLQAHHHLFDRLADGSGFSVLAFKAERLAKFLAYCRTQNIDVEGLGA